MQPLNAKKRKGGIEIEKPTQRISMLKPCTITTGLWRDLLHFAGYNQEFLGCLD